MNFLLSLIVLEIAKISVSVPSIPEACPCVMKQYTIFENPQHSQPFSWVRKEEEWKGCYVNPSFSFPIFTLTIFNFIQDHWCVNNNMSQGQLQVWTEHWHWFSLSLKLWEIVKSLYNGIKHLQKLCKIPKFETPGSKIKRATPICILNSKWPSLAQFWSYKKI